MNSCLNFEDQIKNKLLQADTDLYNKKQHHKKYLLKRGNQKFRKYPHYELSQWESNQKNQSFNYLPFLEVEKTTTYTKKNMQKTTSSMNSYLQKFGKKMRLKSPVANSINLQFNPQKSTSPQQTKNKKTSNLLVLGTFRSAEHVRRKQLQKYLINGQLKTTKTSFQQIGNQRSSHLLKLLHQRQILRRKRYSFDLEGSFTTRSCFHH